MYEWRFDRSFRLTITRDAEGARLNFVGDLDAVTAKNLEQRAELPKLPDTNVVLDLSELDVVDVSGAREIRRIEALYVDADSCEVRGAHSDVRELLELFPRPAA